jgi:hypothetical protein
MGNASNQGLTGRDKPHHIPAEGISGISLNQDSR